MVLSDLSDLSAVFAADEAAVGGAPGALDAAADEAAAVAAAGLSFDASAT